MSAPRRYLPPAVLALALIVAPLSACGGSPQPQATEHAYLADWVKQDWAAMRLLADSPAADFTSVNQAAFRNLSVRQASITAGTMQTKGSAARAPITERLTLAGLGTITVRSELHLVLQNGKWLVRWSPATIAPQLRTGDQLAVRTKWPARASILGAGGTPLTTQGQVVTIGVEGARVKNAASLRSALVSAGATTAQVSSAITAAKAHPTYFEPVLVVSRARYAYLEPAIYPIPGTVFQSSTALSAVTPGLTTGVVGTVGPVTAQELSSRGAPYNADSNVGQTGLEQADERQLAGTPGATVQAIDGAFPPGSTFKVITSTALISHGLTPKSPASCPGTSTVDGEVFHNAEGEAPVGNLLQAFTESCNTAFIKLTAFGGSVPRPKDAADLAATSIGQGQVLLSPLNMAMVAAAADTGTVRSPQLVTGSTATGSASPGSPGSASAGSSGQLPRAVVTDLHAMMASVVTRGTAAGQGLPAGTYAKTGTAEYGTGKPLKIDAWLMGFKGSIAFAALVVNAGGNGGPTCGPIVAKFLNGL